MPATTTPTDVPRRRPHDSVAPAEPPAAGGRPTVWVDRLAVVSLGVCVVALLFLADATGQRPQLPAKCADLFQRPEKFDSLPADAEAVKQYIRERSRAWS